MSFRRLELGPWRCGRPPCRPWGSRRAVCLHLLQACECMCVWRLHLGLGVHLVALVPAWAAVADLAPADASARPCVPSPASRPDPRQRLMDPPWAAVPSLVFLGNHLRRVVRFSQLMLLQSPLLQSISAVASALC